MDGKTNFNLIAIGGFSWFLIMSLSALFFSSFEYLLIPFIDDPSNAYWTIKLSALLLTVLATYLLTKRIWKKLSKQELNINKTIVLLIVAIITTHFLQALTAYHLPFISYDWNAQRTDTYFNFLQETPSLEYVSLTLEISVILTISLLFIKWKQ